ncbi:MAG: class I SAM-dependent methyltransferase [Bacilli bacterium]|nr:class I SAM-dependent methyltransferase [Bacilli bacterium]
MQVVNDFNDYKLINTSDGQKLETWGKYTLLRPDPQIIWHKDNANFKCDAKYIRSNTGGGKWNVVTMIPSSWQIKYHDYTFNLKLMSFKHTGLFPEQAYNWNYLDKIIRESKRNDIKVLNLFAYTGAASIACLKAGASVVHVDSSRGMIDWAKENVKSSSLEDKPIRFLQDDVIKFVKREIRRENKYDIILMDPPTFGRGSSGEVWDIEKNLFELVKLCQELLSDKPLLFLINSYTTALPKQVLENILNITLVNDLGGKVFADDLGIKEENSNIILPCGNFARWEKK